MPKHMITLVMDARDLQCALLGIKARVEILKRDKLKRHQEIIAAELSICNRNIAQIEDAQRRLEI